MGRAQLERAHEVGREEKCQKHRAVLKSLRERLGVVRKGGDAGRGKGPGGHGALEERKRGEVRLFLHELGHIIISHAGNAFISFLPSLG